MHVGSIDIKQVEEKLEALAATGTRNKGGSTRIALTGEDKAGRDLLIKWMRELNLEVKIDSVGNIFGIRTGSEDLPALMMGSHIDTVENAGIYDGNLGVIAGLEIVRALNKNNAITKRPLIIASFTNEEGVRFQPDMMGSLVFSGGMTPEEAHKVKALDDGTTLLENLKRIGYLGDTLPGSIPVGYYLELHIEQGPLLEEEKLDIGIVEGVQGIYWTKYILKGTQNHAGTTPMRLRRDTGYAAAEIVKFVRDIVKETGGTQVGTVGSLNLKPNVINVVAGEADLVVDLRNSEGEVLSQTQQKVSAFVKHICETEGLEYSEQELVRCEPVQFDKLLPDLLAKKAEELKLAYKRMWSGAGHDAGLMSSIVPSAMIFTPSRKGISHNPEEFTSPEEIEKGIELLFRVVSSGF